MNETTAEQEPVERRVRVNAVELATFEWGAVHRGKLPSILLAHATGFHARVWGEVIRRLGQRHIVAIDQRGHGRSEKVPITHWRPMGQDVAGIAEAFGLERAVGVGHSMGGHAMTEAAAVRPQAFERLLLIDPVICSPSDYRADGWQIAMPSGQTHPTARRRNEFASAQEMINRFKDRPPYSIFVPAALRDYCEYGLLPAPSGAGYVLACPPQVEASVYMTSHSNPGVYDSVRALEIPVTILRAKRPPPDRDVMDFSSSPTWPGLVGEFRHGHEVYLPEHTHFLPMEVPQLVADHILGIEPST